MRRQESDLALACGHDKHADDDRPSDHEGVDFRRSHDDLVGRHPGRVDRSGQGRSCTSPTATPRTAARLSRACRAWWPSAARRTPSGTAGARACSTCVTRRSPARPTSVPPTDRRGRRPRATYLRAHPEVNVVMWSWCGQVSTASPGDIDTYLGLMAGLETEFPAVRFVYMTGHLDGTGPRGHAAPAQRADPRVVPPVGTASSSTSPTSRPTTPDGHYYGDRIAERRVRLRLERRRQTGSQLGRGLAEQPHEGRRLVRLLGSPLAAAQREHEGLRGLVALRAPRGLGQLTCSVDTGCEQDNTIASPGITKDPRAADEAPGADLVPDAPGKRCDRPRHAP